MYTDILEATRLTREGRLAEATALIQRSVGISRSKPGDPQAPGSSLGLLEAEFQVIEPAPAEAPAEEAPCQAPDADVTATTALDAPPVRPRPAARRPRMPSVPGRPSLRLLKAKLKTGLRPRHIPAEAIAPPEGRWIEGNYSDVHGSRAYKLYIPSGCEQRFLPLVVMLHGCTQDPDDFAAGTAMNFVAEAKKFLVVYPAQASSANPNRCWNWFQPGDQQRDRGEPALIAGITRNLMAEYKVDGDRVYVAGMSAGGAMAVIMAETYPDLYAAVGVHSGLAPGSANDLPSAFQAMQQGAVNGTGRLVVAVPLILFHGDQDHTVHPQNGEHLVEQWAAAMGRPSVGEAPPTSVLKGRSAGGRAYTREIHAGSGHAVVERWTVHGAGHAWSGGSSSGSYTDPTGPNASRELARFFLEHPRGRPCDVVTG